MPRRQKNPLRRLTDGERTELIAPRRAQSAPAVEVTRAALLLLVSDGHTYQLAARATGHKSGDAVAHLVARFNKDGLAAVTPRHGGGRTSIYDADARSRILLEASRKPTPQQDGTAIVATLPNLPPTADQSRAAWERWQQGLKERITLPAATEGRVGAGQLGRSQERGIGDVAVRSWNYAFVHPSKRIMAEHGGEHPADTEGSGDVR